MITVRKDDREEINRAYFLWLCDLVEGGLPGRNRLEFLFSLHQREFTFYVPNDDNRAEDGKNLREDYSNDILLDDSPCSMLEMLIALSKRIEYILAGSMYDYQVPDLFWSMISNLELVIFSDRDPFKEEKIYENNSRFEILLERRYSRTGAKGGLFPLRRTHKDQRNVEIWYQLMEYLEENYPQ